MSLFGWEERKPREDKRQKTAIKQIEKNLFNFENNLNELLALQELTEMVQYKIFEKWLQEKADKYKNLIVYQNLDEKEQEGMKILVRVYEEIIKGMREIPEQILKLGDIYNQKKNEYEQWKARQEARKEKGVL